MLVMCAGDCIAISTKDKNMKGLRDETAPDEPMRKKGINIKKVLQP